MFKTKKEVKMLRKIFPLLLIIFIPFFIFNQEEPISTHYYLKEWINEDGLLEAYLLEGDSIPPELIPEGFVKVSLEELHQKGYLTASEQLQMEYVPRDTVRLDGRWACSWAYTEPSPTHPGRIEFWAGSLTSTQVSESIYVRGVCERIVNSRVYCDTASLSGYGGRVAVSFMGGYEAQRLEVREYGWHEWKAEELPDRIRAITYACHVTELE